MKLVKPSFEIIEQKPGLNGLLQHIELCGRTCYKSEDKITEGSAPKFVDMIINRGHTAMLEHGTVYLKYCCHYNDNPSSYGYDWDRECEVVHFLEKYESNSYTNVAYDTNGYYAHITTNYRVLLQNNWLDDLQYQCEPTEHHEKRVTVKFVCDRGVSHEFVRHRVFSFAQESTRYCNYSKDKFGNECTFIIPNWVNVPEGSYVYEDRDYIPHELLLGPDDNHMYYYNEEAKFIIAEDTVDGSYLDLLETIDRAYRSFFRDGWIAQQARAVLPNSLKTELVMTGTIEQWKGFFKLRDDKQHAHPQAYELAHPLHEEFIKRGWIKE